MKWTNNPYFIVSLVIFIGQIVIIAMMSLYYSTVNVHNYRLDENEMEWKKDKKKLKFNHTLWGNEECDKNFKFIIKQTKKEIEKIEKQHEHWVGKLTDVKEET